MTLMLMSSALWADETVTVSANSSDISEGLDLKVVAKLFAEAENLEQFETMLNNPDSAFCNLDLNGDGQVDYLRVVETGEGNKRLVVLQAVLAKDIYQDVASIYVVRDEAKNEVSVQIVGDEYVYGTNYIIEPVFVYRPVIYDWFWSDAWFAWHSPWYWGYWPGWWYAHNCWAHDWYWHHCYAFHHHHYCCSFRNGKRVYGGYDEMHRNVTRRDYAASNPERTFSRRNEGMTNARDMRNAGTTRTRQSSTVGERQAGGATQRTSASSRTYGSANTAVSRGTSEARSGERTSRVPAEASSSHSSRTYSDNSRSANNSSVRSNSSNNSSTRSSSRVNNSNNVSRSSYSGNNGSTMRSSYSGGSSSRSSGFSGGGSSRSGGFSGGGGSRGGGGGTATRR